MRSRISNISPSESSSVASTTPSYPKAPQPKADPGCRPTESN